MDVSRLKPGDKIETVDGAIAEVMKESEDGRWILVRYLSGTQDPALLGTEDLCEEAEVAQLVAS